MAKVGVIMPTHGLNRYLAPAVESVVGQSLSDWALVIVCDGAAEETVRLAESFAARDDRIRVVRQARAGVAAARNRGLEELAASVEFVALIDHDDRWLQGTLCTLTRVLENRRHWVGAHGIARFIDEEGTPIRIGELEADLRRRRGVDRGRLVEWPLDKPTTFANLALTCKIPVGGVVVRRSALDRVGRFDERAVPADDLDMWLRLSRLGDFAFVDEVVLEYRQHPTPTWARPTGIGRGTPYVRRKALICPDNTPEQNLLARQGYRFCERLVIGQALSDAAKLAKRRHFGATLRRLARALLHVGGYARGSPGPWHDWTFWQ
jgi:glycosyltransferase involved in cell wall biosynthesis